MMGPKKTSTPKLFYYDLNLEKRMPKDHRLRRIKEVVDFDFVRELVSDKYGSNGHESEDPIVVIKLMLLLFLEGFKSERELMRVLPVRLDWLWFLEMDLDSRIPDHSVLSKARNRWGLEIFEDLFVTTVRSCVEAGLLEGRKIHMDASLVDADASRDSVVREEELRSWYREEEEKLEGSGGWVSQTDADAVVVRSSRSGNSRPRYKHHRAVDDQKGVITAIATTRSDRYEGKEVLNLIQQHERNVGQKVGTVVGDRHYGTNENYRHCSRLGIISHLGDVREVVHKRGEKKFTSEDFEYDSQRNSYRCPAGHWLRYTGSSRIRGHLFGRYRAERKACHKCSLRSQCTKSKRGRSLKRPFAQELIEKARKQSHSLQARRDQLRRKHLVEGSFADATNNHHFKRARWRGLERQTIQDCLIAACQNLRILLNQTGRFPFGAALMAKFTFWHGIRALERRLVGLFRFYRLNTARKWTSGCLSI